MIKAMKSFSPLLWYPPDRVYLDYDYSKDLPTYPDETKKYPANKKVCGYEFFKRPLCDGILVSRTLLESATKVKKIDGSYKIEAYKTIHNTILDYCRIRGKHILTFADPGTWSYVNRFALPDYLYETGDLIEYYNDLQFDLAGSVDWPIVDKIAVTVDGKRKFIELDTKTKEMRRNLTLELAQDFIRKCKKRIDLKFVPFGTIQGYSKNTYRRSLRRILRMGYEYIAIGGLPAYSESQVVELLPMIKDEIRMSGATVGVHLYGRFPSPRYVKLYADCRVTSFDNNSAFIAASRSPCVYFDPEFIDKHESPEFRCYGIKIPPTGGPLLSRLKRKGNMAIYNKVKNACDKTFRAFYRFSLTGSPVTKKFFFLWYTKMNKLLNLCRNKPSSKSQLQQMNKRTKDALNYEGWKRCDCESCKLLGANMVLVRGGNRIAHIFIHNTYVHFARFVKERKKISKSSLLYDWSTVTKLNKTKTKNKK